jgi:hypothetical protein
MDERCEEALAVDDRHVEVKEISGPADKFDRISVRPIGRPSVLPKRLRDA